MEVEIRLQKDHMPNKYVDIEMTPWVPDTSTGHN